MQINVTERNATVFRIVNIENTAKYGAKFGT